MRERRVEGRVREGWKSDGKIEEAPLDEKGSTGHTGSSVIPPDSENRAATSF